MNFNNMLVSAYSQGILRFCYVRTAVCMLSACLGFFQGQSDTELYILITHKWKKYMVCLLV